MLSHGFVGVIKTLGAVVLQIVSCQLILFVMYSAALIYFSDPSPFVRNGSLRMVFSPSLQVGKGAGDGSYSNRINIYETLFV